MPRSNTLSKPPARAKVFRNGRSQAVRIPVEYRLRGSEVSIRRDPESGDLILSEGPGTWEEVFAAMDALHIPDCPDPDRDPRQPASRPVVNAYFVGRRAKASR